ncbi:hypothetical protein LAZ67_15001355 [Cordylochernes scorpioides]|uniref:Uncharacterized protein n=1 Tax=Cordylochernes scorpioides TaxID=51811 RepID=A0ABY6L8Q1_9ARAC|nr:hypothetical protein LAZ67_15001355 [Cordylochernes scorpioides]
MIFQNVCKISPLCTKCNSQSAIPLHIIDCIDSSIDELYSSPANTINKLYKLDILIGLSGDKKEEYFMCQATFWASGELSNPYAVLAESQDKDLHDGIIPIEVTGMQVDLTTTKESTKNRSNSDVSDANSIVKNGGYINPAAAKRGKMGGAS